jgi:hypothetical protein
MKSVAFIPFIFGIFIFGIFLWAAGLAWTAEIDPKEIVTLLRKDAIPAILIPKHIKVSESASVIDDADRVLGVTINGESRAYPVNALSVHEIVNDLVGGVKIAVTW